MIDSLLIFYTSTIRDENTKKETLSPNLSTENIPSDYFCHKHNHLEIWILQDTVPTLLHFISFSALLCMNKWCKTINNFTGSSYHSNSFNISAYSAFKTLLQSLYNFAPLPQPYLVLPVLPTDHGSIHSPTKISYLSSFKMAYEAVDHHSFQSSFSHSSGRACSDRVVASRHCRSCRASIAASIINSRNPNLPSAPPIFQTRIHPANLPQNCLPHLSIFPGILFRLLPPSNFSLIDLRQENLGNKFPTLQLFSMTRNIAFRMQSRRSQNLGHDNITYLHHNRFAGISIRLMAENDTFTFFNAEIFSVSKTAPTGVLAWGHDKSTTSLSKHLLDLDVKIGTNFLSWVSQEVSELNYFSHNDSWNWAVRAELVTSHGIKLDD